MLKKTCDVNNQFLLSKNGLPLIFSGPYEKTNSTFPYSGNLSSADTHSEKFFVFQNHESMCGFHIKQRHGYNLCYIGFTILQLFCMNLNYRYLSKFKSIVQI